MNTTATHAFDNVFLGHNHFDDKVQRNIRFFQGIRLRNGARKAVEQVAVAAIIFLQAVFDQADNNVVGYQAAGVHDFFGFHTQRRLCFNCCAQHVARGNLGNTEFLGNKRGLRAFASTGWTEQDQSHGNTSVKTSYFWCFILSRRNNITAGHLVLNTLL